MSRWRTIAIGAACLLPALVRGGEAPHGVAWDANCVDCHMQHNAPGAAITAQAGNANLCKSCHLETVFPFGPADQAVPGVSGSSHHWSASTTNSGHGAAPPLDKEMLLRTPGAALQCSTCHDQHRARPEYGGTQHVSAVMPMSGSSSLAIQSVSAGAAAMAYLIDVVTAGGPGTTTFRLSNDNGASWLGYLAGAWVAYNGSNGRLTSSTGVDLNDGNRVNVRFTSGRYVVGDRWKFYVTYPFLRADNRWGQLCVDCHRSRNQASLPDSTDGTQEFSHPVGMNMVVTPTIHAPLDVNGGEQGVSGDANPTNDLRLYSDGTSDQLVTCLTCHRVHGADSNSRTEDPR